MHYKTNTARAALEAYIKLAAYYPHAAISVQTRKKTGGLEYTVTVTKGTQTQMELGITKDDSK